MDVNVIDVIASCYTRLIPATVHDYPCVIGGIAIRVHDHIYHKSLCMVSSSHLLGLTFEIQVVTSGAVGVRGIACRKRVSQIMTRRGAVDYPKDSRGSHLEMRK